MARFSARQVQEYLRRLMLEALPGYVDKAVDRWMRTPPGLNPFYRYGTIDPTYTSGLPKIQFEGEDTLSTKQYPYLSSYSPAAGDRVRLEPDGGSWIITGKVVTS